jgi:hypothetical protein
LHVRGAGETGKREKRGCKKKRAEQEENKGANSRGGSIEGKGEERIGGHSQGCYEESKTYCYKVIPANPVVGQGREKGRKKTKVAEPAQGKRKAPEPGDKHGCNHHSLLELLPLPKAYLEAYVKVGGWLYKKPCKDCAEREGDGTEQVLDMSTLLGLKGRKDVGIEWVKRQSGNISGHVTWFYAWFAMLNN